MELDLSCLENIPSKLPHNLLLNNEPDKIPAKNLQGQRRAILSEREEKTSGASFYTYGPEELANCKALEEEIITGMLAGEPVRPLLLKAIKAISILRKDAAVYRRAEELEEDIFGSDTSGGLPEEWTLASILEETEDLKERLKDKRLTRRARANIKASIEAHEKRAQKYDKKRE